MFVKDTHRSIEYRRVIQSDDTTVGPLFDMYADACLGIEMLAAEIVSYGLYIYTQFISDTLRAAAGQLILDTAQFIKRDNHNDLILGRFKYMSIFFTR